MNDMRTIAENIAAIRARRMELATIRPTDPRDAGELGDLEAVNSRFEDMCLRYHRLNLCQAGFGYGQVLRHPADADTGVLVRLGDQVEIVEGSDVRPGELSIMDATTIMARRLGRGLAFRDWHADGRSLGDREDEIFLARIGCPSPPRSHADAVAASTPTLEVVPSLDRSPSEAKSTPVRARRSRQDDLTPDLFG